MIRADAIKQEIDAFLSASSAASIATKSSSPYPFTQIVRCNIGNPQELGQKPLSFVRQVLALCHYPSLLSQSPSNLFPKDAMDRATRYLKETKSMGAYTTSAGIATVREEVAKFIQKRDGFPSSVSSSHLISSDQHILQHCRGSLLHHSSIPISDLPCITNGIVYNGIRLI